MLPPRYFVASHLVSKSWVEWIMDFSREIRNLGTWLQHRKRQKWVRCFTIRKAFYSMFSLFLHLGGMTVDRGFFWRMALDLPNQIHLIAPLPSTSREKCYLGRKMHVMFFAAELVMSKLLIQAQLIVHSWSQMPVKETSFLTLSWNPESSVIYFCCTIVTVGLKYLLF